MRSCTYVLIISSGMVGLPITWQLIERQKKITNSIVEKETDIGKDGSGRNSGVLHAGIYNSPDSLKAKVCLTGARRL